MPLSINACPEFWKDVKGLQKKLRKELIECVSDIEDFAGASDSLKVSSIPVVDSFTNLIINSHEQNILENQTFKYGTQPFLAQGWTLRKLRVGIDNTGKSGGLRVIFCVNHEALVLIFVARKSDCANEDKLGKECIRRFKDYLSL